MITGALCSTWSVWMPQNIQALHGSCVLIPCTFQIPSDYDQYLKDPVGMWKTGRRHPGKISVNLREGKSVTVREGKSVNLREGKSVTVREGDSVTLREGDSVTLTCSAPAPCPSLPPTLSWTPRLSDNKTVFQENDDHTKHVSSVMNFTASHLLDKQEVKCTAVYRLQADNSERTSHTNVTLSVQYSPKNTSVLIKNDWSLTCKSVAKPAVKNYTWYKVTGGEIKVVSYSQNLTCNITEVSGQYYCQAQNKHGLQNSSIVNLHSECKYSGNRRSNYCHKQAVSASSFRVNARHIHTDTKTIFIIEGEPISQLAEQPL
uniref:Ig-like domain-containing protein n=1 Tax=Paramormyrops kingsleyae TaxID=1676925 RepID=A0A3B3RY47_9TELE